MQAKGFCASLPDNLHGMEWIFEHHHSSSGPSPLFFFFFFFPPPSMICYSFYLLCFGWVFAHDSLLLTKTFQAFFQLFLSVFPNTYNLCLAQFVGLLHEKKINLTFFISFIILRWIQDSLKTSSKIKCVWFSRIR